MTMTNPLPFPVFHGDADEIANDLEMAGRFYSLCVAELPAKTARVVLTDAYVQALAKARRRSQDDARLMGATIAAFVDALTDEAIDEAMDEVFDNLIA